MHPLTEGHKAKLRGKIITGSRNYNKYLKGKVFKVVCHDGTEADIRFFGSDFKHLTGIYSNLDDMELHMSFLLQ